jgi:molybdate transport system substrate-binding protein
MYFSKEVQAGKLKVYIHGTVALFEKYRFLKGLKIILGKNIDKIAIINPKTAPYGKASIETLKNIRLPSRVESKFIYIKLIGNTLNLVIA